MTEDLVRRALAAPTFPPVRRRVFRQLLESLLYESTLRTEGSTVEGYAFTARRRYTFDRVTVDWLARDGEEPTSVTRFLSDIAGALDADPACLTRFARELRDTLLNDALAQHARDGAWPDGHRYHPAYKSRTGFDVADNLAYGPEFARPIRPLWLAAHRDIAEVTTSATIDETEFLRTQLGDAITAPAPEFTLVPVHPWQWREHVERAFAEQLADGSLVVLGDDPDDFLAQESIRTLACADSPHRPHLKLAMSLVNTSTDRVLAPHTVHNAPLITDWLRAVVAKDAYLRDEARPILLGEVVGTAVVPDAGLLREDAYGTLACIWRDSLPPLLEPGEHVVPFTQLTTCAADGTPLIDGWVSEHGIAAWVERLAVTGIVPLVHLLCEHGIALEAHAQNMVLLHREGLPSRVALRDFHDGVRFSRAHLAEPELCPPLRGTPSYHQNRNSFVETDDPDLVADFLLDAFFFVNIGELAIFLDDAYTFAERDFWAIVRRVLDGHRERFPSPLFDVGKPTVAVEKLTTRRLRPDTELRLHQVTNPLGRHD